MHQLVVLHDLLGQQLQRAGGGEGYAAFHLGDGGEEGPAGVCFPLAVQHQLNGGLVQAGGPQLLSLPLKPFLQLAVAGHRAVGNGVLVQLLGDQAQVLGENHLFSQSVRLLVQKDVLALIQQVDQRQTEGEKLGGIQGGLQIHLLTAFGAAEIEGDPLAALGTDEIQAAAPADDGFGAVSGYRAVGNVDALGVPALADGHNAQLGHVIAAGAGLMLLLMEGLLACELAEAAAGAAHKDQRLHRGEDGALFRVGPGGEHAAAVRVDAVGEIGQRGGAVGAGVGKAVDPLADHSQQPLVVDAGQRDTVPAVHVNRVGEAAAALGEVHPAAGQIFIERLLDASVHFVFIGHSFLLIAAQPSPVCRCL